MTWSRVEWRFTQARSWGHALSTNRDMTLICLWWTTSQAPFYPTRCGQGKSIQSKWSTSPGINQSSPSVTLSPSILPWICTMYVLLSAYWEDYSVWVFQKYLCLWSPPQQLDLGPQDPLKQLPWVRDESSQELWDLQDCRGDSGFKRTNASRHHLKRPYSW